MTPGGAAWLVFLRLDVLANYKTCLWVETPFPVVGVEHLLGVPETTCHSSLDSSMAPKMVSGLNCPIVKVSLLPCYLKMDADKESVKYIITFLR